MLQYVADFIADHPHAIERVWVVSIDTGWAGEGWAARVHAGEAFARTLGFQPLTLPSEWTFEQLITDRGNFPSQKFQWCAGLLKGVPLLQWLDQQDPENRWVVGIAKREALMRNSPKAWIEECPYHGDRSVWHPVLTLDHTERDALLSRAGFSPLYPRSQECQPCVLCTGDEIRGLAQSDIDKTARLENQLHNGIFPPGKFGPGKKLPEKVIWLKKEMQAQARQGFDSFYRGCGDPFGCGL